MSKIFDDDSPEPSQRLTLQIFAVAFILPSAIFTGWSLIRNMKLVPSGERKMLFILFYIFVELAYTTRLLYCFHLGTPNYAPTLYGIFIIFPSTFTTTSVLIFIVSMINSLNDMHGMHGIEQYGVFKRMIIAFISMFWTGCIIFFIITAYVEATINPKENMWFIMLALFCAGGSVIVFSLLLFISWKYMNELKSFPQVYAKKHVGLKIVVLGVIVQLLLRSWQAIVYGTGMLNTFFDNTEIYRQIYMCFYILLSDLAPIIIYVLFMNRENYKEETFPTDQENNIPKLLNKLYKEEVKKVTITQSSSKSATYLLEDNPF